MHLRIGRNLLALVALSGMSLAGNAWAADHTGKPPAWRFHEPTVLDMIPRPVAKDEDAIVAADQLRMIACQDRFFLAAIPAMNAPKEARAVTLWSESSPGVWQKLAVVQGVVGHPTFLSLGRDLGLVGVSREDKDKPRLWRISTAGEVTPTPIPIAATPGGATPAERRRRDRLVVRLGTAVSQGDSLGVFLLRGRNHGDTQEVLCVRSDDAGKTWQPERSCGSIGYFEGEEGISGLVGFGDGARSFGLLAADIKEADDQILWKPVLFASNDRLGPWRKDQVSWNDGLQQQALRVPLAVSRSGNALLALYGAFDPGGDQVRYCLTRSEDQGRVWSKAEPISRDIPVVNMEHRVSLAAAGPHVAFTYIEQSEDAQGVGRLLLSTDGGRAFEESPLERFYRGQIVDAPAVAASTSGDRIVMASQIVIDPVADPRTFLVVQEYSARVAPGDIPLERAALAEVARLVEQLGADDFESRQRAGRQLGALGRSAKTPLLEAMRRTTDAEVRTRLRLILGKLYPPCLRVN